MRKINIDRQQNYQDVPFPIVYALESKAEIFALEDWIGRHKPEMEAELHSSGAILFRGLSIVNDQDFDRFIKF